MSDDELRRTNMAIVQEYLDAINIWDFDKKRELLAEDAVFEMPFTAPGFDTRLEGRDNILDFVRTVPSIIDAENLHDFELDTLHSDPGEVVATYKSDMVIKPTNLPYKNRYITRWTVRDGKIKYFAEYYDPIPLVVALGGNVQSASIESATSPT
jgi:ketosteroid isomerase-like protein